MRLGVLATHEAYRQHLRPVWAALGEHAAVWAERTQDIRRAEVDTWLSAGTVDFHMTMRRPARHILMEHGCGLQRYPVNEMRRIAKASLILAPNDYAAERHREFSRHVEVIGTPKMDALVRIPAPAPGLAAVSLHWSEHGAAMTRWREAFAAIEVPVIGHAHPRVFDHVARMYDRLGIEAVRSFDEVVARASVYACDHSSTLYEFAALGRPVVMMDKDPTKTIPRPSGLRYRDHADVGPQALPETLGAILGAVLEHGDPEHEPQRRAATSDLYPFLGGSTARAVAALTDPKG